MKILLLDIETAPNLAYVWGLWDQNVDPKQMVDSGYILCWAARWLGEEAMHYHSLRELGDARESTIHMLTPILTMLDEADVVVHFNGTKFDIPILNREFVKYDLLPPSPYKQVDLLQVVKRVFRFESNRLDYVAKALDLGAKADHPGFEMWVGAMNGDAASWDNMERYNKHDVVLLEQLYHRLLPWIPGHPNVSTFTGELSCPKCGSHHYQKRGTAVANLLRYIRYQCQNCGSWFRSNTSVDPTKRERMVNIT